MTGPRDWDKELADIDKLMGAPGGGAPPPAPSQQLPTRSQGMPASAPARVPPAERAPASRKRDTLVVWLKAGLGALGAAALMVWPYDKHCGTLLYVYLVGVLAVFGAGIWTMLASWQHRRGLAHLLGLAVLLAGIGLAAAEILPRAGYVFPALSWVCTNRVP